VAAQGDVGDCARLLLGASITTTGNFHRHGRLVVWREFRDHIL
jgi:hypothetical protein